MLSIRSLRLLGLALAACLFVPVSSAPTSDNGATAVKEPVFGIAASQHQIRLSADTPTPDPICLQAPVYAASRASRWTGLANDEPELQYLPPLEHRVWGEEAYAISLNDSAVPVPRFGSRRVAAHPNLPYVVLALGPTIFVYRTGTEWTRVRTLRDGAARTVSTIVFSPDGRWLAVTWEPRFIGEEGDATYEDGTYTRIIEFDRIVESSSSLDQDVAVLSNEGPLQNVRDILLRSLDTAFQTGAQWTDSEVANTDAGSIIRKSVDRAIARASHRRDAALRRVLKGQLYARSFSPDSRYLFLRTQRNNVSMHNISSPDRSVLRTLSHPPSMGDEGDGRRTASSGRSWHKFRYEEEITWIASSPNGSLLATASRDKTVILWDLLSGDRLLTLGSSAERLSGGQFSHDGSWLAVASDDSKVTVYSTSTGEVLSTIATEDMAHGMTFSPDGGHLAILTLGGPTVEARLVEVETTTWTRTRTYCVLKRPQKPCPAGEFCVGRYFIGFSDYQDAKLYYASGSSIVFTSPRGISVIGKGERESLRISARPDDDTVDGADSSDQSQLLISPDRKQIWSLDDDATLRVWNLDGKS